MTDPTRNSCSDSPAHQLDDVLALEEFLPYQLALLAEQVSRSFSRIYAEQFGISIPEWRVVAILGQSGSATAKTVGERSTMHKTKVSRAVAALEGRGYLERSANPIDMRESFLHLTPSGRDMYVKLVPQALAFTNTLRNALDPGQQIALEQIIKRLSDASEEFRC